MKVRKLDIKNNRDLRKFIQFPFDLYKNNSYWVPQMRAETRSLMDKDEHPFYRHSDADFFIAENNGRTLGRIAAISNTRANQSQTMNSAFFYFFECVDDSTISEPLFNEVIAWAKSKNHNQVYGPKGLLQGDGIGLLVDGFDHVPAIGIPYNYPYYDKLVKNYGFQKKFDYFSGYVDLEVGIPDKVRRDVAKGRNPGQS